MAAPAHIPAAPHTGSVGTNEDVFGHGYFDNLSNGNDSVAIAEIAKTADVNRAVSGVQSQVATLSSAANPPQFLFANGKRQLTIKADTALKKQDGSIFTTASNVLIDCAPTNGKDHYVHLLNDNTFSISTTKENASARLIGGFHALCADAGTGMTYTEDYVEKPHPLDGYAAGDILPQSVWCLNHRPHSEPEGMVYIPSLGFWCDIYLASGTGAATKSAYQGTISSIRTSGEFTEDMLLVNKVLLNDPEFSAAMLGSNETTSVAGASAAAAQTGGAGGRSDTMGR